jgi:hypothetical protein
MGSRAKLRTKGAGETTEASRLNAPQRNEGEALLTYQLAMKSVPLFRCPAQSFLIGCPIRLLDRFSSSEISIRLRVLLTDSPTV